MRTVLLCLALLLAIPTEAKPEPKKEKWLGIFTINKFDKDGYAHGRWRVYWSDDRILTRKGRYKHGKEVGKWTYYSSEDGVLLMREWYKKRKGFIKVKRYHPNGKVEKTGQAQRYESEYTIRYFWFGEWQVFDENGNYSHTEIYKNGNLVGKK